MKTKGKKALYWLILAILAWLIKKILDATGIFETFITYLKKPEIKDTTIGLLNKPIASWVMIVYIILFALLALIARIIYRVFFSRHSRLTRKKDAIKNEIMKDNIRVLENGAMEIRYKVEFDKNDRIYVSNITPYCKKHGETPFLLVHDIFAQKLKCPYSNCSTFIDNPRFDTNTPLIIFKNLVLSELQQQWRNANNQN
jgi:hypothetical protein